MIKMRAIIAIGFPHLDRTLPELTVTYVHMRMLHGQQSVTH